MTTAFVIGYDPGGEGAHGVAALEVHEENSRWNPVALQVIAARSLRDAVAWLEDGCRDRRIVAAGIDTMTEWNSGSGGWRPADLWQRKKYPIVAKSVMSPNSVYGAMAVNGAAFLTLLAPRFRSDDTMITEAHPKVCYFAMTGKEHAWANDSARMVGWLLRELGTDLPAAGFGSKDDCFDAGVSVLAALRGLNGDWGLDLHAVPSDEKAGRVLYFGQTHYWWPRMASVGQGN